MWSASVAYTESRCGYATGLMCSAVETAIPKCNFLPKSKVCRSQLSNVRKSFQTVFSRLFQRTLSIDFVLSNGAVVRLDVLSFRTGKSFARKFSAAFQQKIDHHLAARTNISSSRPLFKCLLHIAPSHMKRRNLHLSLSLREAVEMRSEPVGNHEIHYN
jgi:hypothetical protein